MVFVGHEDELKVTVSGVCDLDDQWCQSKNRNLHPLHYWVPAWPSLSSKLEPKALSGLEVRSQMHRHLRKLFLER
jgi:hypothetical protein